MSKEYQGNEDEAARMIRSRVTLATTDAAAMLSDFASPLTIRVVGLVPTKSHFPSTRT